jgi:hypothetical protein
LSACEGCRICCSLFWTFYFLCLTTIASLLLIFV